MHIPTRHLLSLTVLPQQCSCLLWISLQPGACAKKAQCFWGRVLLQPSLLLLRSHFPEKLPGLLQLTGLPGQPQEVRGGTGCKPPTAPGTGAGQWCQAAVSVCLTFNPLSIFRRSRWEELRFLSPSLSCSLLLEPGNLMARSLALLNRMMLLSLLYVSLNMKNNYSTNISIQHHFANRNTICYSFVLI